MTILDYMAKKKLSNEEQGKIIASRLKQAEQIFNYWLDISRKFQRGDKVEIIVEERPDESHLKSA